MCTYVKVAREKRDKCSAELRSSSNPEIFSRQKVFSTQPSFWLCGIFRPSTALHLKWHSRSAASLFQRESFPTLWLFADCLIVCCVVFCRLIDALRGYIVLQARQPARPHTCCVYLFIFYLYRIFVTENDLTWG